MNANHALLAGVLTALAAAGCGRKETEMCLVVPDEASCPAAEDVDPADLYSNEDCDLEAREVLGFTERTQGVGRGAWDTAASPEASCCYTVSATDPTPGQVTCIPGRPLRQAGAVVCAPVVGSVAPGPAARRVAAWTTLAQLEHASVAAFAQLTLDLMAHGAPPPLLTAVQRAAADEMVHAQLCLAQASRAAGQPLAFGPLPLAPGRKTPTLVELAVAAAQEGCAGETVGAALARAAAQAATDPQAAASLRQIADDEAIHAALSWRIVAWAAQQGGPPVRAAVARALATPPAVLPLATHPGLEAHGLLGPADCARVAAAAWQEVVVPARRTLLAA